LDLPVDVLDLGLHVKYFGLEVQGVRDVDFSHDLPVVALSFELHVYQEDEFFMADRAVRVLVQQLVDAVRNCFIDVHVCEGCHYLFAGEHSVSVGIDRSVYLVGVGGFGKGVDELLDWG
jgi:hypothetical protein